MQSGSKIELLQIRKRGLLGALSFVKQKAKFEFYNSNLKYLFALLKEISSTISPRIS